MWKKTTFGIGGCLPSEIYETCRLFRNNMLSLCTNTDTNRPDIPDRYSVCCKSRLYYRNDVICGTPCVRHATCAVDVITAIGNSRLQHDYGISQEASPCLSKHCGYRTGYSKIFVCFLHLKAGENPVGFSM